MESEVKAYAGQSPLPVSFPSASLSSNARVDVAHAAEEENYTMFDVNLEEVEVTLSFMRWFDGKGLVKDAKLKGVRGVIGEYGLVLHIKKLSLLQTADLYGGISLNHSSQLNFVTPPVQATSSSSIFILRTRW